jgi:hypothetical protein
VASALNANPRCLKALKISRDVISEMVFEFKIRRTTAVRVKTVVLKRKRFALLYPKTLIALTDLA